MAEDEENRATSLMLRLGYDVTATPAIFKCMFQFLKINESKLTPKLVAKLLMTLMKSHSGLEKSLPLSHIHAPDKDASQVGKLTTWHIGHFCQAINEIVSS
jgi:hypothetical protein